MIRAVCKNDLEECVKVIRSSFKTVADEFGFTEENALLRDEHRNRGGKYQTEKMVRR